MAKSKKRTAISKTARPAAVKKLDKPEKTVTPATPAKPAKIFRRTPKHERPSRPKIISAPKLFAKSCHILMDNWKLFAVILVIYAGIYILLVGGLSSNNLMAAKSELMTGHVSNTNIMTTLFSTMLSSGSSGDSVSGVYQSFLLLIFSLVIIWALRQTAVGNAIRARDAFYKGTYPLVPFLLVLLVIGMQLIPALLGAGLYTTVTINGIASGTLQTGIITFIFICLVSLSLYWVSSSIVALYIAAQPDKTPMQALRGARDIVRFRRFEVVRKLIFLPFVLFVSGVVILMPVARYATPVATVIFFGLTVVALAIVHSYLFTLYRELADE